MASFVTPSERNALLLSTLAGASTTVGAALALIRRPGPPALAFLLGLAAGVMGLLSAWELWWVNGTEHGFGGITGAMVAGVALYAWAAPRLPALEDGGGPAFARLFGLRLLPGGGEEGGGGAASMPPRRTRSSAAAKDKAEEAEQEAGGRRGGRGAATTTAAATTTTTTSSKASPSSPQLPPPPPPPTPRELLRLGLIMAGTMTLHNLPEGVAVAAAAGTAAGGHVAAAVAAHNIPEGLIIASPIYAATGSRVAALGLAAASGLSEPVGAAGALLAARAWDAFGGGGGSGGSGSGSPGGGLLPFLLAGAGGVMGAVCVLDLIPEARRCGAPGRLVGGVALGAGVMAATLAAGV